MRIFAIAAVIFMLMLVPCQAVLAQSATMPFPHLVLVDVDGKEMAQIANFDKHDLWIALNIDGAPVPFRVVLHLGSFESNPVYFSGSNCTGYAYITEPNPGNWAEVHRGTSYGVVGPDRTDGTYRMFRSTAPGTTAVVPQSLWDYYQGCIPDDGSLRNLSQAEEMTPNPLAGFHGPNDTVGGMLEVIGGDKLP